MEGQDGQEGGRECRGCWDRLLLRLRWWCEIEEMTIYEG